MNGHPYIDLSDIFFWRSGVSDCSAFASKKLYKKKFNIAQDDGIATAGSCFAQNIMRALRNYRAKVIDVEPPPNWLPDYDHAKFGYSTFSARYGNIYTVPQLSQLAMEAAGLFNPIDFVWKKNDVFIDAIRPAIDPLGFSSEHELTLHRKHHLSKVRSLFSTMDVFVFTLGLTEAWRHRASGTIYAMAPGVYGGTFDPHQHEFVNYTMGDLVEAFELFLSTIYKLRNTSLMPKIILTVSPVPLTATASGDHILLANCYSKSTLRSFASYAKGKYEFVDYFPSFEVITHPISRGVFYENNNRSIQATGVSLVMDMFFSEHSNLIPQNVQPCPKNAENRHIDEARLDSYDVHCDEAILEAFS